MKLVIYRPPLPKCITQCFSRNPLVGLRKSSDMENKGKYFDDRIMIQWICESKNSRKKQQKILAITQYFFCLCFGFDVFIKDTFVVYCVFFFFLVLWPGLSLEMYLTSFFCFFCLLIFYFFSFGQFYFISWLTLFIFR